MSDATDTCQNEVQFFFRVILTSSAGGKMNGYHSCFRIPSPTVELVEAEYIANDIITNGAMVHIGNERIALSYQHIMSVLVSPIPSLPEGELTWIYAL